MKVKVSKEISVLIAIQIQHPPDRRLGARFHNRAEDDTSFAARGCVGDVIKLPQFMKEFSHGTGQQEAR